MHFFYLKNSVKNRPKNVKTGHCQYPENCWKYRKILKILALDALFFGVLQEMIIGFKLYRKKC